jgi:hypothetical protein
MISKQHFKALEKVFAAEIEGCLPFQSKAAVYNELRLDGMVEAVSVKMGICRVDGYELTHAGRMAYCAQCPAPTSEVNPK